MQSHIEPDISQPQAKSEPRCVKDHMWESVGVGAPFTLDWQRGRDRCETHDAPPAAAAPEAAQLV